MSSGLNHGQLLNQSRYLFSHLPTPIVTSLEPVALPANDAALIANGLPMVPDISPAYMLQRYGLDYVGWSNTQKTQIPDDVLFCALEMRLYWSLSSIAATGEVCQIFQSATPVTDIGIEDGARKLTTASTLSRHIKTAGFDKTDWGMISLYLHLQSRNSRRHVDMRRDFPFPMAT